MDLRRSIMEKTLSVVLAWRTETFREGESGERREAVKGEKGEQERHHHRLILIPRLPSHRSKLRTGVEDEILAIWKFSRASNMQYP